VKALFHLNLTAAANPAANITWSVADRLAPFAFDRSREVATITDLTVAPEGRHIARRLIRRHRTGEESHSSVALLDAKGNVVVDEVGGAEARPLVFTPDGKRLLLARAGEEGSDLVLWTLPSGPSRTVVREEPDLGLVRLSPEGKFLLLASSRGVEIDETEESAARNRRHLREKVPDYTPHPHLHVVDVATGTRRRLTTPGDYVLDDAVFLTEGNKVVYGITVPRDSRPWFQTEIHSVDLATGADRIVATFVAGWEVRPQFFAPAPDGKRLAFLGPPAEVGDGQPERNVYNKQVWLLDLVSGVFERLTRDLPFAFAGARNLPGWDRKGNSMLAVVNQGSRQRLARLEENRDGWSIDIFESEGGTLGRAALSRDGSFIGFTASTLVSPPALHLLDVARGKEALLDAPNSKLTDEWLLSTPADASFTGPGGESIEAWWYPPTAEAAQDGIPLILYYYGGSVPTPRVFNTTHQFFTANGYAVLVINPRGAYGYGDAFADFHAGDWGPAASADILAGVDSFLSAHPEIDGDRIGIYGGSYGGFMTAYLVTETDRFAAAVSMYGISDLATYWGQGVWGWTYGDMALAGATPWGNPEEFVSKSPLYRADRINTPLLLLHGLSDSNVTPGESEELFTALAMQNKMVELVLFPGEGHGISGSFANRVAHRTMMLEWFDRFLRDQPEAWEARWE
jgi:dipeptidyl aminopeptidase/acylaminoacyl peptidase